MQIQRHNSYYILTFKRVRMIDHNLSNAILKMLQRISLLNLK